VQQTLRCKACEIFIHWCRQFQLCQQCLARSSTLGVWRQALYRQAQNDGQAGELVAGPSFFDKDLSSYVTSQRTLPFTRYPCSQLWLVLKCLLLTKRKAVLMRDNFPAWKNLVESYEEERFSQYFVPCSLVFESFAHSESNRTWNRNNLIF